VLLLELFLLNFFLSYQFLGAGGTIIESQKFIFTVLFHFCFHQFSLCFYIVVFNDYDVG
jgi:hypothetical protein